MVEESVMETVTTAGAGAAVVSPWWLPVVHELNAVAEWFLPFLGCARLLMQMYYKIRMEQK
jgi:hypothetical protein